MQGGGRRDDSCLRVLRAGIRSKGVEGGHPSQHPAAADVKYRVRPSAGIPDAANLECEARVAIQFVELRARPALRSTREIEE